VIVPNANFVTLSFLVLGNYLTESLTQIHVGVVCVCLRMLLFAPSCAQHSKVGPIARAWVPAGEGHEGDRAPGSQQCGKVRRMNLRKRTP